MTTYFKNSKKEDPVEEEQSLGAVQRLQSLPTTKIEYCDGINWYALATEDFVKNRVTLQCDYATTINLNASSSAWPPPKWISPGTVGSLVIDGQTVSVGQRILVKDQTSQAQNGIYVVVNAGSSSSDWRLERASDYATSSDITKGDLVLIHGGTVNGATAWMQTSSVLTVGGSAITFAKLNKSQLESIQGKTNQISVTYDALTLSSTLSFADNAYFTGQTLTLPGGGTRPTTGLKAGMLRFTTGS